VRANFLFFELILLYHLSSFSSHLLLLLPSLFFFVQFLLVWHIFFLTRRSRTYTHRFIFFCSCCLVYMPIMMYTKYMRMCTFDGCLFIYCRLYFIFYNSLFLSFIEYLNKYIYLEKRVFLFREKD